MTLSLRKSWKAIQKQHRQKKQQREKQRQLTRQRQELDDGATRLGATKFVDAAYNNDFEVVERLLGKGQVWMLLFFLFVKPISLDLFLEDATALLHMSARCQFGCLKLLIRPIICVWVPLQ